MGDVTGALLMISSLRTVGRRVLHVERLRGIDANSLVEWDAVLEKFSDGSWCSTANSVCGCSRVYLVVRVLWPCTLQVEHMEIVPNAV